MKFLHFIREISDSEEEFLEIIQELNSWVEDEKEIEQRIICMPHNISRFNFSRDEYTHAFEIAEQAIQNTTTYTQNRTVKTLAILHCFLQQRIQIPHIESTERIIRNEKILEFYKKGYSYSQLAKKFNISERWIRAIINIILKYR